MSAAKSLAQFVAWARPRGYNLDTVNGEFTDKRTAAAWATWEQK